jgi:hypothetical protein
MFNFAPVRDLPGFRVGLSEDPPGFRINEDGSVRHSGLSTVGGADPSAQQWAAMQPLPCATAHRACVDSGRPEGLCLRALYNCSQNGVPTIFAPGIWGASS